MDEDGYNPSRTDTSTVLSSFARGATLSLSILANLSFLDAVATSQNLTCSCHRRRESQAQTPESYLLPSIACPGRSEAEWQAC
ncbi:hypothetical protein L209DRAFT_756912 [Thermothelomyces heterothallicus CBS 203.75]